ncbi:hypothetical protein CLUG_00468 [Clavispora lusitaniae ATCC 42720]|uniref:Uncharacterized protein n=1 Tax=Clavispora lusitaniae (strain ATCC 42720) TaxID=306902 RepID=C4XWZ5_CLAL4|nr:uncharacterized protein CLUG_00468 [Clavispora lusitaniae ATCC 42720]EEQ36344.1 hypothetical protein CLUG_00468 [Clavispora lusitaniae ATCC 42720]
MVDAVGVHIVVQERQNPHARSNDTRVVHRILVRVCVGGEHHHDNGVGNENGGDPAVDPAPEGTQVKRPGSELLVHVQQAEKRGHAPGKVVSGNVQGEKSVCGGGSDKTQETNDNGRHTTGDHGVDRHRQLLVDFLDPPRHGQAVVSGKGENSSADGGENGGAHQKSGKRNEHHERHGHLLASTRLGFKGVVDDSRHGSAKGQAQNVIFNVVGSDTETCHHHNHPAQNAAHGDGGDDANGDGPSRVGAFLRHVHTRVKGPNGPDGRQPCSRQSRPANGERRVVGEVAKHPAGRLEQAARRCDGHGNDKKRNERHIHHNGRCSEPRRMFQRKTGDGNVRHHARHENAVRLGRRDVVVAVLGNHHHRQHLGGKAVIDGAKRAHQRNGVCVSHHVRDHRLVLGRRVVVGPVVEPAQRGQEGGVLAHGNANGQNQNRRYEPAPDGAGRAGQKRRGKNGRHRGKQAHDGKRHAKHSERQESAPELGLVADLRQKLIIVARKRGGDVWRHDVSRVVVVARVRDHGLDDLLARKHRVDHLGEKTRQDLHGPYISGR